MSLLGNLSDVKIADVLRLFAAGKKSGLLTVTAPGHQATVRFLKGSVVHAVSGRLQGDEAVVDLFGWKDGQMTFVVDDKPGPTNVTRSVDVLILEGVRSGSTVHRMYEAIPSDRVVFHMGPGPPDAGAEYALTPAAWRVLRYVDGVRDVKELTDASRVPRSEVVRILFELSEGGFLERVESHKTLRVQAQGLLGKDAAEIDEKVEADWRRLVRFQAGVHEVELRGASGRTAVLAASFRAGLVRDVSLPRSALERLGVREGEDVVVRPVA